MSLPSLETRKALTRRSSLPFATWHDAGRAGASLPPHRASRRYGPFAIGSGGRRPCAIIPASPRIALDHDAFPASPAKYLALATLRFGQPECSGRRSIVRSGNGKCVESGNARYWYLAYDMINKQAIPMIIEVTARSLEEFGEFNRHPGEELVYVIEGELELYTSLYLPVSLKKGDSIYFDSTMGHAYVAVGSEPCRLLFVCVAAEPGLLKLLETKAAATPKNPKAGQYQRAARLWSSPVESECGPCLQVSHRRAVRRAGNGIDLTDEK